jgi:ubiquitin C-terminal hydrolase
VRGLQTESEGSEKNWCPKVPTCVNYPFETVWIVQISENRKTCQVSGLLNSEQFAVEPSGLYHLTGAVFHSGGMGDGHYTAAAIDLESERWFLFNDAIASAIEVSAAHKDNAYLLFYQRNDG